MKKISTKTHARSTKKGYFSEGLEEIKTSSDTLDSRQRYRDTEDTEDTKESTRRLDVRLSLSEYTKLACDIGHTEETEYDGEWKSTVWDFTRLMKGYPTLTQLSAHKASAKIDWSVTDFDGEERIRFLQEWGSVKYLPGQGAVETALVIAKQKPLTMDNIETGESGLYVDFISLCGWLQILVGEGKKFYLPVRKISEALNCKKDFVSVLRKIAVTDGFLTIREEHTAHRATRFTFDVVRFPCLREWRH